MNNLIKISLITILSFPVMLGFPFFSRAIAQPREENLPACYMRNSQGQLINLGKLCNSAPTNTIPTNTCANRQGKPVTTDQVVISRVNYNGSILTGQVKNTSCQPLQNIRVNYQLLDTTGDVIDNGYVIVEPNMINPGGTGVFQSEMQGAKVETTHLEWNDPS